MTIEQQLIYLFSASGAINGVFLSSFFLLFKTERKLSDYFLGGLLLMLSIRIIKSIFLYFNPDTFQLFIQIGLSACMLIGPFLYLYVTSVINLDKNLRQTWWWYLLPGILLMLWLSYQYPYDGPPNSWGPFINWIYGLWLIGLVGAGYQMRDIFKKIGKRTAELTDEEFWLTNVYLGTFIVFLAYRFVHYSSYIVGAISFTFLLYLSILLIFYRKKSQSISTNAPAKYANSQLSESESEALMDKITHLMKTEKVYLDPALTLSKLSAQLEVNSKSVSQAINQFTDSNYSKYIAHLRITEAKRLLTLPEYKDHKIATIAFESGFKSLSSFNATFKDQTTMTPNQYRKQSPVK